MTIYIKELILEMKVTKNSHIPAFNKLFIIDEESKLLSTEDKEMFHHVVAKMLYLAKRARSDILTTISFLTTRVLEPTIEDWNKMGKVLMYLNSTADLIMRLSSNDNFQVHCYVDASHANHKDFKSHSGCVITMGTGAVHCKSSKQSLVTKSSTEAELVAISDCVSIGLWARNFLQEQNGKIGNLIRNDIPPMILYQDNLSTIFLIEKGRSTSTRTRHVNIRFYFINDRIKLKEVVVVSKSSEDMVADIMTKPLSRPVFEKLRDILLNNDKSIDAVGCTNVIQEKEDTGCIKDTRCINLVNTGCIN